MHDVNEDVSDSNYLGRDHDMQRKRSKEMIADIIPDVTKGDATLGTSQGSQDKITHEEEDLDEKDLHNTSDDKENEANDSAVDSEGEEQSDDDKGESEEEEESQVEREGEAGEEEEAREEEVDGEREEEEGSDVPRAEEPTSESVFMDRWAAEARCLAVKNFILLMSRCTKLKQATRTLYCFGAFDEYILVFKNNQR